MARILDMHKKWMEEPAYRTAYGALEAEFALSDALIDVQKRFPKGRDRRDLPLSTTIDYNGGSWAGGWARPRS
jgi:hypothetical protein